MPWKQLLYKVQHTEMARGVTYIAAAAYAKVSRARATFSVHILRIHGYQEPIVLKNAPS